MIPNVGDWDGGIHRDTPAGVFHAHRPGIKSVSDSPDPLDAGSTITFSVDWDPHSGHGARSYICRSNEITLNGCGPAGSWGGPSGLVTGSPLLSSFPTAPADRGVRDYYAFVCETTSCSPGVAGSFAVNNRRPSILGVSDAPDPVAVGHPITFSVSWSDPDGDYAQAIICKVNQFPCPSEWTHGGFSPSSPATPSYTPSASDLGTKQYFAFVCDSYADANSCAGAIAGAFTVNLL